jgi:hypothetical protein
MNCQGEFDPRKGVLCIKEKYLGVAVDHPNDGLNTN